MNTISTLRCQNCGSSLQVADGLRFITCAYCGTELQIVRDASTMHTEVLDQITQQTHTTVNHLRVIELQNEIAQLDREWDWERQRVAQRQLSPGVILIVVMFVLPIGLSILAIPLQVAGKLWQAQHLADVPWGGIVFSILLIVGCIFAVKHLHRLKSHRRHFSMERAKLLAALEEAKLRC